MYFLVIEKVVHPNFEEVRKLTPLHIRWTQERIKEGRIVLTGRWGKSGGMVIIKADNIIEARQTLNEEPMIKAGFVPFEIDTFIQMYKEVL